MTFAFVFRPKVVFHFRRHFRLRPKMKNIIKPSGAAKTLIGGQLFILDAVKLAVIQQF